MSDNQLVDISKMKVADLKRELKLRGLSTVGNKTELMVRLQESYDSSKDILSSEELIDEDDLDDVENEGEDKSINLEISSIDATEESTPVLTDSSINSLKRKESSIIDNGNNYSKAPPKKIVLNRALSIPADKSPKTEITTKTDDSTQPLEKKIIKLSNLTTKERLEMRAKKFGVSLTHDQKKEARMERFSGSVPSGDSSVLNSNPNSKVDVLKKRAERFGGSVSSVMSKIESREKLERRKARFGTISPIKGTTVK